MKNLKFLTLLALISCSTDPEDQFCKNYNSNEEEFAPIQIVENFAFSVNILLKIYSYIGKSIEINFYEVDFFNNQNAGIFSGALKPFYTHNYTNILSTVYRF